MNEASRVANGEVEAVRAFNRFYTRQLGLLDEAHLDSGLSLPEVRVLYEVAHGEDVSPGSLAKALALDAGYVSRLVSALEKRGALARSPSTTDARRAVLKLTTPGRRLMTALEGETKKRLETLLAPIASDDRSRLVAAMTTVEGVLSPAPAPPAYLIRDPRPGDIGWVIHRQAEIYADEYGWDWTYEGLIAEIAGRFVTHFDPEREHCWLAERDGVVVGSVFVVRKSARTAQLRMLYVDPSARGLGIGARLVALCVDFARARGYRSMMLWTNDVLVSARRIYQAAGFTLIEEEPHRSFGKDLVGQNWSLAL
jgi:DNA-binding MarR family transcriptional regulator/GNAT superfamily N-acetyltransferase